MFGAEGSQIIHVAILQGRCLICLTRPLTPFPMLGCSHWCHQTTSLTLEVLEGLKNLKAIQGGNMWKYVETLNINEYHPGIIPFHREKLPEKFLEAARKSHEI